MMKTNKSGLNTYLSWEDGMMHKILLILPSGFVAKYNASTELRVVSVAYLRYFLLFIILLLFSVYPIGKYTELLANPSGLALGTITTLVGFALFVITKNPAVGTYMALLNSMLILVWFSYSFGGMANNILRHDALVFSMGMFFGKIRIIYK